MEEKKNNNVLSFFITTLNGMAYGLFATLIIGTILGTIGTLFHYGEGNGFCDFMYSILGNGSAANPGVSYVLEVLTGAGIGVGVALVLKLSPLQTIVLASVGELASYFSLSTSAIIKGTIWTEFLGGSFKIGDPLTVYLVCIVTALVIQFLLKKKTPVDIILVPMVAVFVGTIASLLIRYPAIYVTYGIQWLVNEGTNAAPFFMGIIVSVVMGMALTAPISSAAIAAMIFTGDMMTSGGSLTGLALASGAAIIGCSTQMVGLAVESRKDNPLGMVISVGIGTSMLQFKNILRKPVIWLPTIIASAILGPVSTCGFHFVCMGSSAGMGTSGLVGQIGTFASMGNTWQTYVGIFGFEILAPMLLVFGIDLLFRRLGWIKEGDFKI